MKNPTGSKLCISHKTATSREPLLKVTVLTKSIIRIIYNKLINPASLLHWPLSVSPCFTPIMTLTHPRSYARTRLQTYVLPILLV